MDVMTENTITMGFSMAPAGIDTGCWDVGLLYSYALFLSSLYFLFRLGRRGGAPFDD
jgi:hypothetical protein